MIIMPARPAIIEANRELLPVTNLLDPRPGVVFAASINSELVISLEFDTAILVHGLALLFSNATSLATWEIRAAASVAGLSSPASIVLPFGPFWASTDITRTRRHSFAHLPNGISFRFWRISLRDVTNPEGTLRIGRLVMGTAVVPLLGWDAEGAWSVDDYGLKRDLNGPQDIEPGAVARVRELQYSMASRLEMVNVFRPLFETIGTTRDVLLVENPEVGQGRERSMIYGTLVDAGSVELRASNVGEVRLKIKERL
jgi:hypothetical protein